MPFRLNGWVLSQGKHGDVICSLSRRAVAHDVLWPSGLAVGVLLCISGPRYVRILVHLSNLNSAHWRVVERTTTDTKLRVALVYGSELATTF